MSRLLYFLYQRRAFIVFVLLEAISVSLIVHEKFCQASASYAVGSVQNFISVIKNYPSLQEENTKLLHENAMLRTQLLEVKGSKVQSSDLPPPHLMPAQVINNAIVGTKNYLTLNKGAMHGIVPGMGVVCDEGIVGSVKAVSDHFAVVTSLLHTAVQVSAQLSSSNVLGTVQWPGRNPRRAHMLYVPRHVCVQPGDTVVASGYNATFFAGALIGHVIQVELREEASFYDIELCFSTDFSTLHNVYIVKNMLKREKVELEQRAKDSYE